MNRLDRDVVFIALFAALIAALGLIPMFNLPFAIPITAQTLGVMLCGTILGMKRGVLAVLLFLLLVLVGLPLLSGGRGGYSVFLSPSVGFLVGWPIAAFVTGYIFERYRDQSAFWVAVVASIVGCILVLYVPGILGMAIVSDISLIQSFANVMWFIPGDLMKAFIAGYITVALLNARPQSVLSRA